MNYGQSLDGYCNSRISHLTKIAEKDPLQFSMILDVFRSIFEELRNYEFHCHIEIEIYLDISDYM